MEKKKSLNDPIKDEDGQEWQDWLVDNSLDQELKLSQDQEFNERKKINEYFNEYFESKRKKKY